MRTTNLMILQWKKVFYKFLWCFTPAYSCSVSNLSLQPTHSSTFYWTAIIYQLVPSSTKVETPKSASPPLSDVQSPAASKSPSPCPSAESAVDIGCLNFLLNPVMRYQFRKSKHSTFVSYWYFLRTLQCRTSIYVDWYRITHFCPHFEINCFSEAPTTKVKDLESKQSHRAVK